MAYLKFCCHALGLETECFNDPLLRRTKAELKKREAPPKPHRCLRQDQLQKLMVVASGEGDKTSEMLYLAAHALLLQVPSEGLPLTTGQDLEAPLNTGVHSCASVVRESWW